MSATAASTVSTSRSRSSQPPATDTILASLQRAALHLAGIAALAAASVLIGCAALPADVQRPVSQALADQQTTLARSAAAALPANGADQSGLRLIPDGDQALAARIALIRRAERSLDVQTYHLASDSTGALFLNELRRLCFLSFA